MRETNNALAIVYCLYIICFLPSIATAEVEIYPYDLIYESIKKHPAVVEKKNQVALKGLDIDVKIAQEGVKIDFSTRSKIAMFDNLNTNQYRVDDIDRSYLDGVVTVQKTLYDAGKSGYDIDSDKLKQKAAELAYLEVYELTLQKLLKTAIDAERFALMIISLDKTIEQTKNIIAQVKLRFSNGVGTIMEVRQAQLWLVDLQMEQQELKRQYKLAINNLDNEFSIKADKTKDILQIIDFFTTDHRNEKNVLYEFFLSQNKPLMDRSLEIINNEKKAINFQIKSLQAAKSFSLTGILTGVLYDVTRDVEEYEVYSGVNVSLPIYDSGLNNARQDSLAYQINLQNDALAKIKNDKQIEFNNLSKKYQQLIKELKIHKNKFETLEEKISQIDLKLTKTGEGLLNKLQNIINLAEVERFIQVYPFYKKSIIIDYYILNEQLLTKIAINPTIDN